MSKWWNTAGKVWNMWQSPVMREVSGLAKAFVRHYHDSNGSKVFLSPKTAVGVSEFKKLVLNSTVFVDKSLLIKDFLEDEHETLLITYPRRWGKSLNLDMIRQFLSIEVDQDGTELPLVARENRKLFTGGTVELGFGESTTLEPLQVANHINIMKRQGQFPVIHIDLKNTKGNSYDEILSKFQIELHNAFLSHRYLSKSTKLKRSGEDEVLERYINPKMCRELTPADLSQGLSLLSKLLHTHFDKKAFVLMDEYDAAINHSYIKFSGTESERVISFFRDINETTFKGNTSLEKGLVTGVFRIAKANLFSGLNNLGEYGILDREFSQYYGFTQEEVEYLFEQYGVTGVLAKEIGDWYNGYAVGGTQIYNPWSMVKCLNKFQKNKATESLDVVKREILQSYWEESGNIDFIKDLFKVPAIKSKVDKLVKGEPLFFNLKKQISSSDFKVLKEVMNLGSHYKIDESVSDVLFSYLFSAGYLTVDETRGFRLPNNEIKVEFQRKLLEYYKQQYSVDIRLFTDVTDQLQKILDSKDQVKSKIAVQSFKDSLATLLAKFPEFTKIKDGNIKDFTDKRVVHANEDLIHSVMSYITLQLNSLTKFGTEIYLGEGRADIMFVDELNQKAAIIELKYDAENAKVAVEQIKNKEYAKKLLEKWNTALIGVSVSKDKVIDIEYEEVPKDDNFSGNGTSTENNSCNLPYSGWFSKYYSEGIEKILQLRMSDLDSELLSKVKVLPARYQLNFGGTDVEKIVRDISELDLRESDIVLVPYNIENKHWVGMIFKKHSDGFEVVYSDPENKAVESVLFSSLERVLGDMGQKLGFKQDSVKTQKYNNCGSEVIENFMYYLTGSRVEEEETVIYHSKLVENCLLEPEFVAVLGEIN